LNLSPKPTVLTEVLLSLKYITSATTASSYIQLNSSFRTFISFQGRYKHIQLA